MLPLSRRAVGQGNRKSRYTLYRYEFENKIEKKKKKKGKKNYTTSLHDMLNYSVCKMLFHLSRPWGSDNGVRPRKKYPRNISLLPPLLNNSHDFRNCKLIRTQTFVYHIHTYYICNRSCFLQIKLTDRSNRFVSEFY